MNDIEFMQLITKKLEHTRKKYLKKNAGKRQRSTKNEIPHKVKIKRFRNDITSDSNSDNEVNKSESDDEDWEYENCNISPSKSEVEMATEDKLSIDTIYHNENTATTYDIFSSEESSEYLEDSEDLIFANVEPLNVLPLDAECKSFSVHNMHNGRIIVLKNKGKFYFHGIFNLSVLLGNVQILGYNLIPNSPKIEVYSLRGFSYLYIENIHTGHFNPLKHSLKAELEKLDVKRDDIYLILSDLQTNDSIIACSMMENLKIDYVEKHISQKLLPIEDNLPFIIEENLIELNILNVDPIWDSILKGIDQDSKLMLCGGKGVGKSTILRYFINRLLMKHKKVFVIDLDPGQSEFTVPGCVAGVIIENPLFGPSFTHLKVPERCIFIEDIDISLAPDIYINCVIELVNQCEEFSQFPILVNYVGYSQSYGMNLASTVITHIRPTVLLQINSNQDKKNFTHELIPDVVKQYSNMFTSKQDEDLTYEFIAIDSICDGLTSWQAQGRTIREMSVLSYFSQILDNSLSLTSRNVPLYEILLKDIILVNKKFNEVTNKSAVFNASLVALCSTTQRPDIYDCHGWGIIRGIDKEKLILITPVCEDILKIVTHLALGSVSLPPSVLMSPDENRGLMPYVSLGCISTFNNIPKRSYLPKKIF